MFDKLLPYIPYVSGLVTILTTVGVWHSRFKNARHESAYRTWTEQQEAALAAGGPRFKLQVLLKDRAPLEWALAQGRLRVTKDMPWGWYVVAETRLAPRGQ